MKLRALWYALGGVVWGLVPALARAQALVPVTQYGDCSNPETAAQACNICAFGQLAQNIINFTIGLSIPIAVLLFAYAGWLYFTSAQNEENIKKAKRVFQTVFIGFIIALSGWMLVQTLLKGLAPGYVSWNTFQCTGARLMNVTAGEWLSNSGLPTPNNSAPQIVNSNNSYTSCPQGSSVVEDGTGCFNPSTGQYTSPNQTSCPSGSSPDSSGYGCQFCYDNGYGGQTCEEVAPLPTQVGAGDCPPSSMQSTWGDKASTMSCIAQHESSCNPGLPSGTDRMKSSGESFSWGLYQINLTANPMMCPDGTKLNCPSAFNGKNYNATVADRDLYNKCIAAAQNVQCNTYTAKYLANNTPNGIGNWSTAKGCGY